MVKIKFGITSDYIICTSADDYRKNISTLLTSFSIFNRKNSNKYSLVIVGRSSPQWKEEMNNLWANMGNINEKLIFTGFISNNELNQLYNGANLFVFPSLIRLFNNGYSPIEFPLFAKKT